MTNSTSLRFLLSLPILALAATPSFAQRLFATQVITYAPGGGGGIFVPTNALGGPTGLGPNNGSLDVTTLGVGGSITLGFDVTIADGPGVDFSVFENGFVFAGEVFAEVAYVEVSTDNVNFARVPSAYAGPVGGFGSGFTAPFGTYFGLTGGLPVLANVQANWLSPFDPVYSGGEAFDLAVLANDPLVVGGLVQLNAIHYVRIVDSVDGVDLDTQGNPTWDNSGANGSADIDAVAVIHHTGNVTATAPKIDLYFDAQGFLNLEISDPNGFGDVDRPTLAASFNQQAISLRRVLVLLPVTMPAANGVVLRSAQPITGSGLKGVLAVSVRDFGGEVSADQIVIQG